VRCGACDAEFSTDYQTPVIQIQASSKPLVIEQTSKKYKSGMLLGSILMLASFPGCVAGADSESTSVILLSVLMFFGGAFVYTTGRIGAWWNHG
jgi:hypothetical protein